MPVNGVSCDGDCEVSTWKKIQDKYKKKNKCQMKKKKIKMLKISWNKFSKQRFISSAFYILILKLREKCFVKSKNYDLIASNK